MADIPLDSMTLRDHIIEFLDHNNASHTNEEKADVIIDIVCEFLRWGEEASRGDG